MIKIETIKSPFDLCAGEDFGLQLIDYHDDLYEQFAAPILNDSRIPPLQRILKRLE